MDLCLFQFGFDDNEFKHSDCDASHWELRPSGMIQRRAENLDAVAMGINKNAGKGWQDHIILKQNVCLDLKRESGMLKALVCTVCLLAQFQKNVQAIFCLLLAPPSSARGCP